MANGLQSGMREIMDFGAKLLDMAAHRILRFVDSKELAKSEYEKSMKKLGEFGATTKDTKADLAL